MKHLKTISIALLVFLLLLTGCSVRAEQTDETDDTDWEEIFPFQDLPAESETQAPEANATIPLTASDTIFNAKFEGNNVAGKGEVVDDVYRFTATKTDREAWHVKLECNYPTVAGRDYFVTYKFNSNVAGKIKFGDFQEFQIKKGENTVTGVMIASGGTSYLDLQLGMLSPFTIDFTEIEVKEFEDEATYENALPSPIDFERESRVYERHDSGYTTVLIRRENAVNVNYLSAPMDSGVWKSRLYIRTGLVPEPGVRYRVTADAMCDEDMPFELLFNNGDEEKGYGALYDQKIEANKVKKIEAVVTGNGNVDELILQASLGEAPDGGKVIFGNVNVEKITDGYKSILPADFRLDNSAWTGRYINCLIPIAYEEIPLNISYDAFETVYEQHDEGYVVELKESYANAFLKIKEAPAKAEDRGVWKVRLYAATGVDLVAGKTYRVKYDLVSNVDQADYEACFDGNKENAYGVLYGRSLKAGQTDHVEQWIMPETSSGPLTLRLQLGKTDTAAGNKFLLSGFSLEEVGQEFTNVPLTDFSYDTSDANVREQHDEGYVQSVTASGNSATLDIQEAPESDRGVWKSKLLIDTGVTPEANTKYVVSFDIVGTKDQNKYEICFDGNKESTYGILYDQKLVAGETKTIRHSFDCVESAGPLKIRLQLGETNDASGNEITVSNIKVCKIVGTEAKDITPESFAYPVTTEASTKDNSFKVENNEGAQAELTGDGSSATAKVVKSGDDWHIKFYAFTGAELKKGQTYHVTMDVAGADGCGVAFKNPSVEGETGFGSGTITGGKIDHTITPEENGTLEVILKIGTVAAGNEVKVSNLKITQTAEDFIPSTVSITYPTVIPGSSSDGSFSLDIGGNAEAKLSGNGSSATAKVITPGDDWHVKFYVKPGVELQAGQTYRVTMNVSGADGYGVVFKNLSGDGETGFGSGTITGGKIDQTITPDENGTLEVILKIGNVPAGTDVTVSGFKIEKIVDQDSGITPQSIDYVLETNEGAEAAQDGRSVTVTKPGDDWHVKFYVKPKVTLESGKKYKVTMNVTGADGCTAAFKNLAITDKEDGFGTETITGGSVSHVIEDKGSGELEVILKIGKVPVGTKVTVNDIQLYEVVGKYEEIALDGFAYPTTTPEQLNKGSFNLEANPGAQAEMSGNGSSATAKVITPGDDWHVKFYVKPKVTLESGKKYKVTMNVTGADGCTAAFKNLAITDKEDGFGTETITGGSVSHVIEDKGSGELEVVLRIGNVASGTEVTVSDFKFYEYKVGEKDITPESFAYPVTTEASTKDNSFKVENNEGAQAELTGDGSSATAKVVKSGDDWHIKFYAFTGAELKKGQTYHVTMDVAGADGCGVAFKNPSVEGETGFGSGTITGGKIDHTITPEENGTLEVILKIGTVAAGNEVKVSNLKIEEVKETEGENLMTDPLKVPALINSWNDEGYVTSLSNTDSSATMNIEKVPASGREAWKIKLFAETHQKLEAGKTYRVSVDVQSASPMGYEVCYNNGAAESELGNKASLNASSTKQTITYNVSPSKEAELTLQFNLGNAAAANSFTISNIKIEDAKEVSSKNLIPNFRYNAVGYLNGMADEGYVTSFRRDDSSATFKIKKAPDERNPWNAKVTARTGFTPEAGKGYRVSVDVTSNVEQKLFEIFYDGDKELDYGALYEQKLPAGTKTFSYIIYPGDSKGELVLQLRFGKTDDNSGNKYVINNIKVEEVTFTSSSSKEIKNTAELVTQSGYNAELIKSADRASVRLLKTPKNGREAWKNKLFVYPGVKLEEGQKYRITAVVKSIIPAPFEICLNDGDVEKGLGGIFGLMSRPQGAYITYASYVPKDIQLAVQLSLGNCVAPNTITLSDVKVEKAGKINQVSDKIYIFR